VVSFEEKEGPAVGKGVWATTVQLMPVNASSTQRAAFMKWF